jgi:hypothetical protein
MNWPALWKESGIDPESEKAEAVRLIIESLFEWEGNKMAYNFSWHQMIVEHNTSLLWPRIQEILRSE